MPFRVLLGVAVSLLCLWLAIRVVPFDELRASLAGGTYEWLLVAAALQVLVLLVRAQRWAELLGGKVGLSEVFWAQSVGNLLTYLIPLRAGEVARIAALSSRSAVPVVQVATTAVAERVLDVATIGLILVAVLPWMQVPTLVSNAGVTFGALVAAAVLAGVAITHFGNHSAKSLVLMGRLAPQSWAKVFVGSWKDLIAGLWILNDAGALLRVVGLSVAVWALTVGVYWCALQAFEPAGSALEASFMLIVLALATAVPSSPGFIGVYQLAGQQALVLPFGDKYTPGVALAVTLAAHATSYLVTTPLGVAGLLHFGGSIAALGKAVSPRQILRGGQRDQEPGSKD